MTYNEYLQNGFESYRKWFNKFFKLSFKGKFCGLLRLGSLLPTFINRLGRMLHRSRVARPLGEVITFKLHGNVVKLYNA